MRLLDAKGGVIAEAVVGKKRSDAFGFGKVGTYVRKPGDAQTWLANVELDASADLKDWVKTDVFQVDSSKVNRVTVEIPGEQPLKIERNADKKLAVARHSAGPEAEGRGRRRLHRPRGRLSSTSMTCASWRPAPAPKDASTIKLEADNGLTVTLRLRKDGDAQLAVRRRPPARAMPRRPPTRSRRAPPAGNIR